MKIDSEGSMQTHVCKPELRLANTAVLRDAVFRFRYQVYIEEKGWTNSHADHRKRTLSEPLDETGIIWIALCNDRCIGTLRSNLFSEFYAASYGALYELESLNESGTAGFLSNFVIESSHRNLRTAMTLVRAAFSEGIRLGVQTALLDCEPQLVSFYQWLGFEVHRAQMVHPEYGPGVCMKMKLERWAERFQAAQVRWSNESNACDALAARTARKRLTTRPQDREFELFKPSLGG